MILKELHLQDFRGQTRKIEFSPSRTRISGTNALGKTTIFEAFLWLVVGTDALDRANYRLFAEPREFSSENAVPAIVKGVFEKDGAEYTFTRQAKEKWVRERGSADYKKSQNDEYKYFADDLEVSAGIYKERITEFFGCGIDKLKLILNIRYFRMLDWKDLRKHLADLVGDVVESDYKGEYSLILPLIERFEGTTGAKEYVRQQNAPFNGQIVKIDADIEANRALLPSLEAVEAAEAKIAESKAELEQVQRDILGLSEANKPFIERRNAALEIIADKRAEYLRHKVEHEAITEGKLSELQNKIASLETSNAALRDGYSRQKREADALNESLVRAKKDLADCVREYEILKEQNLSIKNRVMDETCPVCGSMFYGERLAQLQNEFRAKNDAERAPIIARGKLMAERIEELKTRVAALEKQCTEMVVEPPVFQSAADLYREVDSLMASHVAYPDTEEGRAEVDAIKALEAAVPEVPEVDASELTEKSRHLTEEIASLAKIISMRDIHAGIIKKIEGLQAQKREINIAIGRNDGILAKLIEREREWADIVRQRAAKYFDKVSVEMLGRDKGGNLVDICSVSLDGVDVRVVNTAGKVYAGIDISNAFSKKYGIKLPLFIDNAEQVASLDGVAEGRQLITMEVAPEVKELTIVCEKDKDDVLL